MSKERVLKTKEDKLQREVLKKLILSRENKELIYKKTGVNYTLLGAWVYNMNHVPLMHVGKISRLLKVSPYLLNYKQVFDFYGGGNSLALEIKTCNHFSPIEIANLLNPERK